MRFTDRGPAGIPPPMVQPDPSGASPSPAPSSSADTGPTPAPIIPTSVSASQMSPGSGDVVGVRWRLSRIDEAGLTTDVPAAAGEWIELSKDGQALGKFTSCEVNDGRWTPTNSGMLTQFFQESDRHCPPNAVPAVHTFAGSRLSQVVSSRVETDGDHLTITAGPETLTFDKTGAKR